MDMNKYVAGDMFKEAFKFTNEIIVCGNKIVTAGLCCVMSKNILERVVTCDTWSIPCCF